jgi:hypothetical protein
MTNTSTMHLMQITCKCQNQVLGESMIMHIDGQEELRYTIRIRHWVYLA